MINRRQASLALCAFTVLTAEVASAAPREFAIRTVSSRADVVSGGQALVEVSVPGNLPLHHVRIAVDGRDVTSAFRLGSAEGTLLGVVDGLSLGRNTIELRANRGRGGPVATLVVTNHPISGPIISGPHQTPYICETQAFGLGAPLDADCAVTTRVDYFYRSTTTNSFQPLNPVAPRPADVAVTTTTEGHDVPYIVRREMGTVNRAVYVVAFLHEPGQQLPDPWSGTPGWNNRLIYSFGGGCRAGYHQGRSVGGLNAAASHLEESQVGYKDHLLARGYAVVGSSLNVFGTTCADLISAESVMMLKEYFIKRFGAPRYTIGAGGSGGSMQQSMIAGNYPGLLDGIIPGRVYPDNITFFMPLFDCELLMSAFDKSALAWTPAQKTAVSGLKDFNYCVNNGTRYPNLRPQNCDPLAVPVSLMYDPVNNRGGARCTYQDNMVNVYGLDQSTGFARRPFDNVGVQYGLGSLNSGLISFEQFVELNARIGGHDIDGKVVGTRTVADLQALRTVYRTGRLTQGAGGLTTVPIIDLRSYLDGTGDVHDAHHSKILRARLLAANGNADNHVMVTVASTGTLGGDIGGTDTPLQLVTRTILAGMDQWLANIAADRSHGNRAHKVARNKPADLVDSCYTASLQKITDLAQCAQIYPYSSEARIVAGEPWTADRLKCALKPVDSRDYVQQLTAAQLGQLRAIFPDGVCDYRKPGMEQQPLQGTWLTYPGGGNVRELGRDDGDRDDD